MTPKAKALLDGRDGSRKRDFSLSLLIKPEVNTASYWSGGSRDHFVAINMATGARTFPPTGTFPAFDNAKFIVNPGTLLLETGMCMGKPYSATFHHLPDDENKARVFLGLALKLSGDTVEVEAVDICLLA